MDLKPLVQEERAEFLAFLEMLTPEQWQTSTLCAGWTVHDLVAHVVSYDELSARDLLQRMTKARFSPDRANALGHADYRSRSPEQLLELLRAHQRPSGLPAAFGGRVALTDGMIHQQDVRRPLGLPREIPARRLLPVLRFALIAPPIRGWRAWGVRLVATDLDFAIGFGPEVRGPAEALLMIVAGRHGILDEVTGPGRAKLMARIER